VRELDHGVVNLVPNNDEYKQFFAHASCAEELMLTIATRDGKTLLQTGVFVRSIGYTQDPFKKWIVLQQIFHV
jgi:hypothetical protein